MAKNAKWGSSTTGSQHTTSGKFKVGDGKKKGGGCDLIAAPVGLLVLGFVASLILWPAVTLKVTAAFVAFDLLVVMPWLALAGRRIFRRYPAPPGLVDGSDR